MNGFLKQVASHLPYPLLLRAYAATVGRREASLAAEAAQRASIPLLDGGVFRGRKRSDTVFVLGSGSSINRIGAERWQGMAAHDTIALNFWPIHPFVPTYYLFESVPPASDDPTFSLAMFPLLLELFARRAEDYAGTPKVISNLARVGDQLALHLPEAWRVNLFWCPMPPVVARTPHELGYCLRYLDAQGVFATSGPLEALFKYGSNLVMCLSLAIRLGYRRIVLCGVDLSDQAYFYQDRERFPEFCDYEFLPRQQIHKTARKLPWLVPIDQVLLGLIAEILEPRGIELFVENRSSALWPRIPEAPADLFAA